MSHAENVKRLALATAVKALQKSVERSLMTDTYVGTAAMMAKQYRKLHSKIAEHYPDDYYITDVLLLEVPEDADERQVVSLVQISASQLHEYLKAMGSSSATSETGRESDERRTVRDLGEEFSQEIMRFTSDTLRRALSNIEFDMPEPPEPPVPPEPPKRKQKGKPAVQPDDDPKVSIDIEFEDEDDSPPPGDMR